MTFWKFLFPTYQELVEDIDRMLGLKPRPMRIILRVRPKDTVQYFKLQAWYCKHLGYVPAAWRLRPPIRIKPYGQ